MRCAHTEVRLCIVQMSCVCLCTNWKKTTNKEGTMLVYAMHILSHVEKMGILTPLLNCRRLLKAFSCHIVRSIRSTHVRTTISHIQMFRKVLRCVIQTSVAHLANINREPDHLCVRRFSKSVLLIQVIAHSSSRCEQSRSEAT